MISKLTKTIILIVFVVFLGMNNVHADKKCTYTKQMGMYLSETYEVVIGSDGKTKSITYYYNERPTGTDPVRVTEDKTGSMTFEYNYCPSAVSISDNKLVAGTDFKLQSAPSGTTKTCKYVYYDPVSQYHDMYTIEIEDGSKRTIYYERVTGTNHDNIPKKDVSDKYNITFNYCPASINVSGSTISEGGKYKRDGAANSNNVGNLEQGNNDELVSCGDVTDIPAAIPNTTKIIYSLLQVFIPIILVVFGLLDLMKGISAQKEDEIKKGQQNLVKRLISAAIVFFIFAIVKALATFLSDNTSVGQCLNCFIKGDCASNESASGEE